MRQLLLIAALFFVSLTVALAESDASDLTFVSREEWGGRQPRHPATNLETQPPVYAIIGHTYPATGKCSSKDNCIKHMRNLQDLHTKQFGYNDITFNFLVGGDGNVYVARGWGVEGAHTEGYNTKSLGIGLIGDFSYSEPTDAQIKAVEKLLELAVNENKLAKNYKLLGQRQVSVTKSPGQKVYDIIKTWEHWAEKP